MVQHLKEDLNGPNPHPSRKNKDAARVGHPSQQDYEERYG